MLRTVPETAHYKLSVLQTLTSAHTTKPFLASQEMAEEEFRLNEEPVEGFPRIQGVPA